MKILVLGSEGQIGSSFCNLASKRSNEIIRFDKKFGIDYDLSTNEGKNKLIDILKNVDVVLFLAFQVGGAKYLKINDSSFEYISENIKLMENTFEVLKSSQKPFLFASSQMSNMYHTNYGLLKCLGERYTKSCGGWICRFWNVYGHENPTDPKSHVITDFIHMAKTTKKIKMMTNGSEERQFLHVEDCSEALLKWCENYKVIDKDQYLDITSHEWTSILEIAVRIGKILDSTIEFGSSIDTIQNSIKNTPCSYFNNFWNPKISLANGIKDIIRNYDENFTSNI